MQFLSWMTSTRSTATLAIVRCDPTIVRPSAHEQSSSRTAFALDVEIGGGFIGEDDRGIGLGAGAQSRAAAVRRLAPTPFASVERRPTAGVPGPPACSVYLTFWRFRVVRVVWGSFASSGRV